MHYVIIENSIKVERFNKDGKMKTSPHWLNPGEMICLSFSWWYSAERYYFFFHNNACHLWHSKTNCEYNRFWFTSNRRKDISRTNGSHCKVQINIVKILRLVYFIFVLFRTRDMYDWSINICICRLVNVPCSIILSSILRSKSCFYVPRMKWF